MPKLPFQHGVIVEQRPHYVSQSIPFDPRFLMIAHPFEHNVDVNFDPRLGFTETSLKLATDAVSKGLFRAITASELESLAWEVVGRLHDIHSKGELIATENMHLETTPLWKHDCDECVFLGSGQERDFYFCKKAPFSTLIARYGSHGEQYLSGAPFAVHNKWIWAAAVLAESMKLGRWLPGHHTITIHDKPQYPGDKEEW